MTVHHTDEFGFEGTDELEGVDLTDKPGEDGDTHGDDRSISGYTPIVEVPPAPKPNNP